MTTLGIRLKVVLREITEDDYELMLRWRNDPDLAKGFYSQKDGHVITRDEHLAWLKSRNKDTQIFMIYAGIDVMQKVGVIAVSQLDYWEPETGTYIGEKSLWGKGIATKASIQVFDMLRARGYKYTRVTILNANKHAQRNCRRLGFERVGDGRPGESIYRLKL